MLLMKTSREWEIIGRQRESEATFEDTNDVWFCEVEFLRGKRSYGILMRFVWGSEMDSAIEDMVEDFADARCNWSRLDEQYVI